MNAQSADNDAGWRQRVAEWWRQNTSCCGWRSARHDWRGCGCNCHEEAILRG